MSSQRAVGFSKHAARYQGDLHEIALFPYNGLTTKQRVSLLEDHHRRRAYGDRVNPLRTVGAAAAKGAFIASAAVASRQFGYARQAGAGVRKAMAEALHVAKWPAPVVGAAIAAPFGLLPVIRDAVERRRSMGILSMKPADREVLLHKQVAQALR